MSNKIPSRDPECQTGALTSLVAQESLPEDLSSYVLVGEVVMEIGFERG